MALRVYILSCLLIAGDSYCNEMPQYFLHSFIRDLAEHYHPTPLTLVYNRQDDEEIEGNVCSSSVSYCLGYAEDDLSPTIRLIGSCLDQTVIFFIGPSSAFLLNALNHTIFKHGKEVFVHLNERKDVP